jgi:hypothetical protein
MTVAKLEAYRKDPGAHAGKGGIMQPFQRP